MNRGLLIAVSLCAAPLAGPAAAQTCFRACLKETMTATDIDDQGIRDLMSACSDRCADEAEAKLTQQGLAAKIDACTPQRVPDAEMKQVRSASPSVVAFANAFTWDVHNVLPGKIIRRIELSTQTMSLQEVTLTATGMVEPGGTATFFMNNVADGYPSLRVTSRVKAIFACDLH